MERIKIITDSTCDLPEEIIKQYDIEVIPLTVNFDEEAYKDGVDINLQSMFEKMEETSIFPTTSQINPKVFYDNYKKYLDKGYKIISIHLSSKMSGTYQSACIAKETLETEDIIVIDSFNVTSGLGLLVIKTATLIKKGLTIEQIEKQILETIPHVKSALAFQSLDHLIKGGRLPKAVGVIGNLLGIKLILSVENGEMVVIDKVRGSKKAVKNILNYIDEKEIKKEEPSILLHVMNKDILEPLREKINSVEKGFVEAEVGCVVGVHSGPNACGIFFIEDY